MIQNRTNLALFGFISDVGGLVASTLLGFMAAPIFLEFTSQTLYGFWLTTISILGYLALTDLGMGMSLSRYVASLAKTKNAEALNGIISTGFFTFCGVGLVFLALGLSIAPFIPLWFNIPAIEAEQVLSAYRLAIVSGALALPLSTFSGVVFGFQKMAVINISSSIVSIVGIGFSILLLYSGLGLVALPLASMFTVVVNGIIGFYIARLNFPALSIRFGYFKSDNFKKLVSFGGNFQLGRVANTVALSSDNIVIAGYMGAENVTPFAFTSKLPVLFSVTLASKLPTAIFPALTEMFVNSEMDKLRQTYQRLTFFSVRIALLAGALIYFINPYFISLWVGPQYYGGDFLNIVFVFWALLDTVYRGTTAIVYASGDMRNWALVSAAEAILNIVLSILFIRDFGLAGVALGTLMSKALTTGFYTPFWVCRKINLSVRHFLRTSIWFPIFRSMPSILVAYFASLFLPLSLGWFWLVLVGSILMVANFLMFEGLALMRRADENWKVRLRKLVLLQYEY